MDITSKSTGDNLTSVEFNQIPTELEGLIAKAGIAVSDLDLTQLAKAVTQLVADCDFYSTSGTANAIVLSVAPPRISPPSLTNGFKARFISAYDNTSGTTVNIAGFGAINIKRNGRALVAGDIKAGTLYNLTYISSSSSFEISKYDNSPSSVQVTNFSVPQKNFILAYDVDTITVKAGTKITLSVVGESEARLFSLNSDTNYDLPAILDTGSISNGKDYYLYLTVGSGTSVNLVASLNATYPSGFTASNSRKIGGLHTLCANVGTIAGHPLTGYVAGNILPSSVWTLAHRPTSEPVGMFYDPTTDVWVDIYKQSGTGASTSSVYGATVTDTRAWADHQDDFRQVKKRMPRDYEFSSFSFGSNQKTSIYGSASPTPKTAGGHVDTASRRMISHLGAEECCGYLYEWLDESAPVGGSGFTSYDGTAGTYGQMYGTCYALLAGGYWSSSSSCGSRSRNANNVRSNANANNGRREVILESNSKLNFQPCRKTKHEKEKMPC